MIIEAFDDGSGSASQARGFPHGIESSPAIASVLQCLHRISNPPTVAGKKRTRPPRSHWSPDLAAQLSARRTPLFPDRQSRSPSPASSISARCLHCNLSANCNDLQFTLIFRAQQCPGTCDELHTGPRLPVRDNGGGDRLSPPTRSVRTNLISAWRGVRSTSRVRASGLDTKIKRFLPPCCHMSMPQINLSTSSRERMSRRPDAIASRLIPGLGGATLPRRVTNTCVGYAFFMCNKSCRI